MEKYIRDSIYFKDLEEQEFRAILRCFNSRVTTYKKNATIVNPDDDTSNIYIILKGHARSYTIDINGKEIINREYYDDDIFGIEYTSLDLEAYNEELVALEETIVLICNAYRFLNPCENRCKRHIDCQKLTCANISKSLFNSTARIHSMCQSKTRVKILSYLKNQANGKKKYFKIPFNQTELATFLGVERSALSVELNNLKKEGIIDFDERSYRIIKKKSI
ncbi:MAG: Crp/Fnr family transcriptional regulator [Anaeroplasmataceae bacterium]